LNASALDAELARVLVVGLGVSGRAVAERLLSEGRRVRINDLASSGAVAESARRFAERGAEVVLGHHEPQVLEGVDLVVVSPGVRSRLPLLAEAESRGIPVWSEVEFAWRYVRGPVAAVTGTNGKTTTVSMLEAMLRAGGKKALAAGNIGLPLTEAACRAEEDHILVVEVSSFQLVYVHRFRPHVAVLLNIAEDHFDWHADLGEYAEAKSRIWMNQEGDDLALCSLDYPLCVEVSRSAPARLAYFSRSPAGEADVYQQGGTVYSRLGAGSLGGETRPLFRREDVAIKGEHNLENAMAAAAAASYLGVGEEAIREALRAFRGLSHRVQLVGEAGGLRFYDDSKATNPHAALHALSAFQEPLLLILGGRNKGLPFDELAQALAARWEKGALRKVYAVGEAAEEIAASLARVGPGIPVERLGGLEEVFERLPGDARPGDVVLLSPACASFDRYRDYRERGAHFQELVKEYARERGDG